MKISLKGDYWWPELTKLQSRGYKRKKEGKKERKKENKVKKESEENRI